MTRAASARKGVWLIFMGAIVVAMALPIATTLRQSSTTLEAQVSVWPAHPRAGQDARLVISLVQVTDRAAARGPWAQLVATWDMATMDMGTQRAAVQGAQDDNGIFTVPLHLDMAGPWWIHATLQTPGRPAWHGAVEIMVAPGATPTPSSIVRSPAPGWDTSGSSV
ncbi:MAG: hypothetical protein ACLQUY_21525 [Ktedonobacterales bacterium]